MADNPLDEERELVEKITRELAGTLHSADCGWNCPGHGIMQERVDARYLHMAKAISGRFVNVHVYSEEEKQALLELQPIQLVARAIIYRLLLEPPIEWDSYSEIGERDWERVVEEVRAMGRSVDPGTDEFEKAYQQLADRAENEKV